MPDGASGIVTDIQRNSPGSIFHQLLCFSLRRYLIDAIFGNGKAHRNYGSHVIRMVSTIVGLIRRSYRQIGGWRPRISVWGLSSYLTTGSNAEEEASRDIVRRAYEGGIDFFDTANRYGLGKAEKVLGGYLAEFPRSSLVVLTKVYDGWEMAQTPADSQLSISMSNARPRSSG
jgi:hypothetical protein